MMKNDDFRLLKGFASRQTDGLTDICECRVAFATENCNHMTHNAYIVYQYIPVLFSILIWFSICIKLSVFRNNSISLGMGMDDAKNSIFFGKWIPSNQILI